MKYKDFSEGWGKKMKYLQKPLIRKIYVYLLQVEETANVTRRLLQAAQDKLSQYREQYVFSVSLLSAFTYLLTRINRPHEEQNIHCVYIIRNSPSPAFL